MISKKKAAREGLQGPGFWLANVRIQNGADFVYMHGGILVKNDWPVSTDRGTAPRYDLAQDWLWISGKYSNYKFPWLVKDSHHIPFLEWNGCATGSNRSYALKASQNHILVHICVGYAVYKVYIYIYIFLCISLFAGIWVITWWHSEIWLMWFYAWWFGKKKSWCSRQDFPWPTSGCRGWPTMSCSGMGLKWTKPLSGVQKVSSLLYLL